MNHYIKWIVATIIGGVSGYLYWYFIGCNSGSCPITSSPVNSTAYGAIMGFLFIKSFTDKPKKRDL